MRLIFIVMVIFLIVGMVFVSGCTATDANSPKTQEEAQKAVMDVSGDVQDVENILADIDSSFG